MLIPHKIIFLLLVVAGLACLQLFLSKRPNKWVGLVLPIITFVLSLIYVLNIMDTGNLWSNIVLIISTLLLANIPTVILLAIYLACRDKKDKANKKKAQLEKMNIQDLE